MEREAYCTIVEREKGAMKEFQALATLVIIAALPRSAAADDGCVEILRQGVYDYYHEKDRRVSSSDVRSAIYDALDTEKSGSKSGGLSIDAIGYGSGSANFSKSEAEAMREVFSEDKSAVRDGEKDYSKNIRKVSRAALDTYKQCMALKKAGIQASMQILDDSHTHVSFTIKHATGGSTSRIDNLVMNPPGAFTCRGTLAGAKDGSGITTDALNMQCSRHTTKDDNGVILAPGASISINTPQGSFNYYFKQLKAVEPLPALPAGAAITPGAILAFEGRCPIGWDEYKRAAGRVVIGAGQGKGLSKRGVGDVGGAESVKLSIAEMPKHDHGAIIGGLPGATEGMNEGGPHNAGYREYKQSSGGQSAHENMPPFITLQYCVKK